MLLFVLLFYVLIMVGGKKDNKDDKEISFQDCVLNTALAEMLAKITMMIREGNKVTNKSLNTLAWNVSSLTERVNAIKKTSSWG